MVVLNTIVNVDKAKGISSFGVVRELKKIFNIKKIGHLGTLDPIASGVLPVFVGKATKLIPLFNELDKEYRTVFKLGQRTDTFDAEGSFTGESSIGHLEPGEIESTVARYVGTQTQLTPIFSAVKLNGVPAYRLARQGKPVERKEKSIRIDSIVIESVQLPLVTMRVRCSKGTYIRSLVDDIGQDLHVGAHMVELERIAVGPHFSMKNAFRLEEIARLIQECSDFSCCINPVHVLSELPTVSVTEGEQLQLQNGRSVALRGDQFHCHHPVPKKNRLIKAVDSQKKLIAIGHIEVRSHDFQFNPSKIFV
ncbi:MAG: tRNA pseudouridine(55) synthase TruB [SAR324 cluster bacterium]|nr:tRNA pseudouridine(55) synthase TruB [SAR324 cluster bacterium]